MLPDWTGLNAASENLAGQAWRMTATATANLAQPQLLDVGRHGVAGVGGAKDGHGQLAAKLVAVERQPLHEIHCVGRAGGGQIGVGQRRRRAAANPSVTDGLQAAGDDLGRATVFAEGRAVADNAPLAAGAVAAAAVVRRAGGDVDPQPAVVLASKPLTASLTNSKGNDRPSVAMASRWGSWSAGCRGLGHAEACPSNVGRAHPGHLLLRQRRPRPSPAPDHRSRRSGSSPLPRQSRGHAPPASTMRAWVLLEPTSRPR